MEDYNDLYSFVNYTLICEECGKKKTLKTIYRYDYCECSEDLPVDLVNFRNVLETNELLKEGESIDSTYYNWDTCSISKVKIGNYYCIKLEAFQADPNAWPGKYRNNDWYYDTIIFYDNIEERDEAFDEMSNNPDLGKYMENIEDYKVCI